MRREFEIVAAAGIVAGLVYWLLAGRNAGQVARTRTEPAAGRLRRNPRFPSLRLSARLGLA